MTDRERPVVETLSMFDGVTETWWGNGANNEAIDSSAAKALHASGNAQAVHRHDRETRCVRGGGCYVLRFPETDGG